MVKISVFIKQLSVLTAISKVIALSCNKTKIDMRKLNFMFFILLTISGLKTVAQDIPVIRDRETAILEPLKLSGPRVGVTYMPNIRDLDLQGTFGDSTLNPNPFVSQFGWQFEWKYFETREGSAGLFEVIPLIGGLDQGIIVPSLNFLTGFRTKDGFEFGAGPNFNLLSSGFSVAVGHAFKSDHMTFPVNLAFTQSRDGARFTLLFGFTKRRRA